MITRKSAARAFVAPKRPTNAPAKPNRRAVVPLAAALRKARKSPTGMRRSHWAFRGSQEARFEFPRGGKLPNSPPPAKPTAPRLGPKEGPARSNGGAHWAANWRAPAPASAKPPADDTGRRPAGGLGPRGGLGHVDNHTAAAPSSEGA